jgi:hypothetical protein
MHYSCLECDHEVTRGWLPNAICGWYTMFLLGMSFGPVFAMAVRTHLIEAKALQPELAEPIPTTPWWVEGLRLFLGLAAVLVGAIAIDVILSSIEYRFIRRKPCPQCGKTRWSRGYVSGMGL